MPANKKIVVTGAAGFIGSHLVDTLVQNGWEVVGIDLLDDGYDPALKRANLEQVRRHPRFHFEIFDIRDDQRMRDCLQRQRPRVLMHLAARVGAASCMAAPDLAWDVNVNGTRTVFQTCRDLGIRMIHVSSAAVFSGNNEGVRIETDAFPPAATLYVRSKQEAETVLNRASDQNSPGILILRLASTYGPRQRPGTGLEHFVSQLNSQKEVCLFADRAKTRDLLYIEDAVAALMKSLNWNSRGMELVHIGSGKRIDMLDLVQKIASSLGVEPKIRLLPAPVAYQDIPELGVEKAKQLFGFKAETPIDLGIERLINWTKNHILEEKNERTDRRLAE